ncbi:hypothetical protein Q0M54_13775, partial [Staphylococcus aureus]|nr:hypothetical protein [Staphylococcus aureus]
TVTAREEVSGNDEGVIANVDPNRPRNEGNRVVDPRENNRVRLEERELIGNEVTEHGDYKNPERAQKVVLREHVIEFRAIGF